MNKLEQFASEVLTILSRYPDWDADTTQAIANRSFALGLAGVDDDNRFRRVQSFTVSRVVYSAKGGSRLAILAVRDAVDPADALREVLGPAWEVEPAPGYGVESNAYYRASVSSGGESVFSEHYHVRPSK